MAKGDVTLKFDAQTAAAVQSILAARNALDSAAQKSREFGDVSAKAGDKASEGFGKASEGGLKLVAQITGIATAAGLAEKGIEAFVKTFEQMFERAAKRAEELQGKVEKLSGSLAVGGQGAQTPEVRERLERMGGATHVIGGRVINPEEQTAIFSSVSRALGSRATVEQKLEATEAGLKARADNMSLEDSQAYAEMFGNLSRYGVQDQAYKLFTGHGPLSDREMTGLARSKNRDEFVNVLIASRQSDEQAKALLALQKSSEEEISPTDARELQKKIRRHPHSVTDEDRRKLAVYGIQQAGGDVFHEILNNPDLAPASDRLIIRNLQRGMRAIPNLPTSIDEDIARQQAAADQPLRDVQTRRDTEARNRIISERGAEDSLKFGTQAERYFTQAREKNRTLVDLFPFFTSLYSTFRTAAETPGSVSNTSLGTGAPGTRQPDPVVKAVEDLHDTLKEQNSTLRTRRDTTLSNSSEGQK